MELSNQMRLRTSSKVFSITTMLRRPGKDPSGSQASSTLDDGKKSKQKHVGVGAIHRELSPRPSSSSHGDANDRTSGAVSPRWGSLFFKRPQGFAILLLLVGPCIFVAWGVVLWFQVLATHEECDMTWMHPNYRLARQNSRYALYQYRDSRDPRPVDRPSASAVLFVPGHGGSYQQGRSVGAHILKLTRQQLSPTYVQRIQQSLLNGEQQPEWVVYTLDFREEPTGLHGQLIVDQSEFIAESMNWLHQRHANVIVLAHSLGGYSSLLAAARGNCSMPTIVTLGTPHQHPVLTWDWTIRSIRREIQHYIVVPPQPNLHPTTLISISGGLRDEIIPPHTCQTLETSSSLSRMAVNIMKPATELQKVPPSLGMDHRAIVWCHNLLEPIMTVLESLVESDPMSNHTTSAHTRLQIVQKRLNGADQDYGESLRSQSITLRTLYGSLPALAMETAALYNAEWLISLYSSIALYHWVLAPHMSCINAFLLPVLVSIQAFWSSSGRHLSWWSLWILSGTALTIFWGLRFVLWCCQPMPSNHRPNSIPHVVTTRWPFWITATGLLLSNLDEQLVPSTTINFIVVAIATISFLGFYVQAIAWTRLHPTQRSISEDGPGIMDRTMVLLTWLLPLLPFLVAGEFVGMLLRQKVHTSFWCVICVPQIWWTCHSNWLFVQRLYAKLNLAPTTTAPSSRRFWKNMLRILAAVWGSDRLYRTLWTPSDCFAYDAPLVFQVLSLILCVDLIDMAT